MNADEVILLCKALGIELFNEQGGIEQFKTVALVVSVCATKKADVTKLYIDEAVLRYDAE